MTTGNIIVNPEVRRSHNDVFAFDAGVLESTTSTAHEGSFYAGTRPMLNRNDGGRTPVSHKLNVQNIEVSYARQVVVQGTPGAGLGRLSTDGFFAAGSSGLSIAAIGDNGGALTSNLRISDLDTTAVAQDGNEYVYYLGHPTERALGDGILTNFAARYAISTKSDVVYQVNLHVVTYSPAAGPPQTSNFSNADLNVIKVEASRIWEQVGVRLVFSQIPSTVFDASQWDLPDDDAATRKAVTTLDRANGIDVYLVNSIANAAVPGEYIAGVAAYEGYGAPLHGLEVIDWDETGVIISARKTGPTSGWENPSTIARTLAHEIGHYLFKSGSHDTWNEMGWNLMRPGSGTEVGAGSTYNSDLRLEERDAIHYSPETVNSDED